MGTYVQTQHDDFADVVGQGAIPIIHDQNIWLSEARLALDAGLTSRFSVGVTVPFRVVRTTIRYLDGSYMPVELVEPSPHHRNETLSGIGDPMLLGAVHLAPLTVRAGLTLPLGKTENNPFAMPDTPHEHIQFGTGTFNPVVSVEAGHTWGQWRIAGFGFTQQVVYANSKGYHAGDRYAVGVAARLAVGSWGVRTGLELQAESYERWGGKRYTEEGNQGRIDAMVALGASYAVDNRLSFDVGLKLPFITHVVGGQLDMPALLEVGASYSFGGKPAPHRHDHEHGHDDDDDGHDHDHAAEAASAPLDTTGADIADLGHAGARIDLIPVPGKITIFDFGAEWCAPCKTLEPVLVELAKARPDSVALRRIDVGDWDTPVVAQYLTPRGFDLPHVKIYDAHGALIFEESSGPGKLQSMIARIRTIAGGAPPASPPIANLPTSIDLTVTERGFSPAMVDVPSGVPVTLRITRKTDKTCATDIVFEHDGEKVTCALPLNQTVELTVTFKTPGPVTYACAMDMVGGTINVR